MKSISKNLGAALVAFIGSTGVALAIGNPTQPVPEPTTMSLVGLAVAGVIAVSVRRRAK